MKKLILLSVICVISMNLNTVSSQELISQVNVSEIKLNDSSKSSKVSVVNPIYFKAMRHSNIARHIEEMRQQVASFDCKTTNEFTGEPTLYQVNFKSEKGTILVYFDNNGKIVKTEESFQNIKLPKAVRESVFGTYKNWALKSVKFQSEYNRSESPKNYYKVVIGFNGKSKTLKVNDKGEFL